MVEHLEIRNFTPISFEDRTVTFKTSLDIIQEVMNVPMCALTSLLRANGYDDVDDTTSLCIDEKGLRFLRKPIFVRSGVTFLVLFAILAD